MLFVRYHLSLLIKKLRTQPFNPFGLYSLYGPCSDDLPRYFYSTGHLISGIVATIIIIYASYKELSLIQVACIGCFVVVMIELIL